MLFRSIFLCLLCSLSISGCKPKPLQFNGYIDADLVYLSSDYPGRLSKLLVHRGEHVKLHQPLFSLENTNEKLAVSISRTNRQALIAQKKQLLAQLHYNESNYNRTLQIRKADAASQLDLEATERDLQNLREQVSAIDAQIEGSYFDIKTRQWQVSRKASVAPDAGIIYDTYYTENEFVQAGQPVLALVAAKYIKVIFYIPEKQMSTIALNQKIILHADNAPHLAEGTISYIANTAQYTPPIIYSLENRHELIFRVEAHLIDPDLDHIHLGQPVTLEITA